MSRLLIVFMFMVVSAFADAKGDFDHYITAIGAGEEGLALFYTAHGSENFTKAVLSYYSLPQNRSEAIHARSLSCLESGLKAICVAQFKSRVSFNLVKEFGYFKVVASR